MGNYLSVAEFEGFIGLTYSATTSPTSTQISSFIDLAEIELEDSVGVYKTGTTTDEICDGHYFGLLLKKRPLVSVTSLSINYGTPFVPNWTVVYSNVVTNKTKIAIEKPSISKLLLSPAIVGTGNYKITYVSGYTTIPANIKYLVFLMAYRKIFNMTSLQTNGSNEIETIDVGVYRSVTNGGNLFNGIKDLNSLIDSEKKRVAKAYRLELV